MRLGLLGLSELGVGGISGNIASTGASFEEYFYFSIASYTTLGIGDIHPHRIDPHAGRY